MVREQFVRRPQTPMTRNLYSQDLRLDKGSRDLWGVVDEITPCSVIRPHDPLDQTNHTEERVGGEGRGPR